MEAVSATCADLEPIAVGVKVGFTVQVALATKLPPHVLVWAKSPELVPVILILPMFTVTLPTFLIVLGRAALVVPRVVCGKLSEEGV